MYMIDNLGSGFNCGTASCETGRWSQSWGTKDLAFSMRSLRVSEKEGGHGHRNTYNPPTATAAIFKRICL